MEGTIYTVPELTRIFSVVGDHISIKFRFSFIGEINAEMALFSISNLVKLYVCVISSICVLNIDDALWN